MDAQRAAVCRQLLHVDDRQAVCGEDPARRPEREVREMLVVDGVELVLVEQTLEVGELEGEQARGCKELRESGDEVVEVRHLGEDVVADDEVRPAALGRDLAGDVPAEEPDERRERRAARRPPRRWRQARCRGRARRRLRNAGAGTRRCCRPRRRGCSRRGRARSASARRSAGRGRPSCPSTRRSTRIR